MTIKFYCPNCDAIVAFDSKHAGKRARCLTCGQIFIIPQKDGETPKKIKAEPEYKGDPVPGFYHAVFIDSWKLFLAPENAAALISVVVVVCFKFFVRHWNYHIILSGRSLTLKFYLPFGIILTVMAWAALFWYYMKIIYSTAFDVEQLPEVYIGGMHGLIWNTLKSLYKFFIMLMMVELPYIITILISKRMGIELPILTNILMFGGLFFFPMAILTTAVGKDLTLLRPDYLLAPVFKALAPYSIIVALLIVAALLEIQAKQFENASFAITAGNLALNLAVQVVAIVAMRSIGLFFRHYSCYLKW
jgi:hypothetical protein